MKVKPMGKLFALAGGALLAWTMSTLPAAASDLTVRFAWYMPPHTATAMQGNTIADNIKKMSDGHIKVLTYPSGSLLNASNLGNGVSNGTVNMGLGAMHWWAGQEPALEWDTIPFLVNDAADLLGALHGPLGQEVNRILAKHNVEIIGWGFYGYAKSMVNNKHPIKVPSDLKGLKMRSEGTLSAYFLKSQGAIPVAVDSSEVYTAIQRGTLNGGLSGLSSIVSRKWYEVGKYLTAIHYTPLVYPLQANKKWWDGLTAKQQSTIKKAISVSEQANLKEIEKEFKDDIKMAQKAGDQVYQPTKAELAMWKKAMLPMAKKNYIKQTGADGKAILKAVQASMND